MGLNTAEIDALVGDFREAGRKTPFTSNTANLGGLTPGVWLDGKESDGPLTNRPPGSGPGSAGFGGPTSAARSTGTGLGNSNSPAPNLNVNHGSRSTPNPSSAGVGVKIPSLNLPPNSSAGQQQYPAPMSTGGSSNGTGTTSIRPLNSTINPLNPATVYSSNSSTNANTGVVIPPSSLPPPPAHGLPIGHPLHPNNFPGSQFGSPTGLYPPSSGPSGSGSGSLQGQGQGQPIGPGNRLLPNPNPNGNMNLNVNPNQLMGPGMGMGMGGAPGAMVSAGGSVEGEGGMTTGTSGWSGRAR
jgi:hypothetical protein